MELSARVCEPCRGGTAPLSESDASKYLEQLPGWSIIEGGVKLERRFEFADFASAMKFSNEVAAIAEDAGHHPDMTIGWGYCRVVSYTHAIGGLHENDFILAARVNEIRVPPR